MTKCFIQDWASGLITKETAKAIFGPKDYQFFMEALVSVDLAIKLKGDHIYLKGSALADNIYYDVHSHSPKLYCNPSIVEFGLPAFSSTNFVCKTVYAKYIFTHCS